MDGDDAGGERQREGGMQTLIWLAHSTENERERERKRSRQRVN